MTTALEALQQRLSDIYLVGNASGVLSWEQQTYMPPGGAEARAAQMSALQKLAHQLRTSDESARLLEAAEQEVAGLDDESFERRYVRVARRDYDQATKLPNDFVARLSKTRGIANAVWREARASNDFAKFQPHLEEMFRLMRESADYLGYEDQPYDALLDQFEPGITSRDVSRIFGELREQLVPLVQAIAAHSDAVSDTPLHQPFDIDTQRNFGELVIQQFGFDFTRGRQDVAPHPFCSGFSTNDVRITTRFDPNWLSPALFGTFHETGHALYEQGFPQEWEFNIMSDSASLAVHESQSRTWENLVGRSRAFWQHYYPTLQTYFPQQLGQVRPEDFYRAVNRVQPSLIRVEADEVTYNLQVMLRYDLESAVINEGMAVRDLPEAWNSKMQDYLGITPPNDADGVMQDIHWSWGLVGYFPTYTLGTLLSVQFYNKAVAAYPNIPGDMAQGKFDELLRWSRENIHQHGRKYEPKELVQRITGGSIQVQPFMDYLRAKFSDIYGL